MKKTIPSYILLLFCMVLSLPLASQSTGSISGVVVDSVNSSPLWGTIIKVEGTNIGAESDGYGKYVISNLAPGIYDLRVSYIGYEIIKIEDLQITENEQKTLNFVLVPKKTNSKKKVHGHQFPWDR